MYLWLPYWKRCKINQTTTKAISQVCQASSWCTCELGAQRASALHINKGASSTLPQAQELKAVLLSLASSKDGGGPKAYSTKPLGCCLFCFASKEFQYLNHYKSKFKKFIFPKSVCLLVCASSSSKATNQ